MGLVMQHENDIYIHSNKTKISYLINNPQEINRRKAQLALKQNIVNRFSKVISLDGKVVSDIGDIELLEYALQGIAEGFNIAISSSADKTFDSMQAVINSKSQLALMASNKLKYQNIKTAYAELDKIFSDLGQLYKSLYNIDKNTLLWCLQNSPRLSSSLQNSALGKYIKQVQIEADGNIVSITADQMQKAEELGQIILHLTTTNKDGTVGISHKKAGAIKGQLTDFYGKVLGEDAIGVVTQGLLQDVVNNVIDPIMYHTGKSNIVAMPGIGILSKEKKMPTIRSDNYSDYLEISTEINDSVHTISGYIGLTDKWMKEVNGQIGSIWKDGTFHPGNISLLNYSPIVRYIDELSTSLKDTIAYSNAYFHNDEKNINVIEQDATLAGLTGSGGEFNINGKKVFDITSFLVLNGKFYSTLTIFLNLLKDVNWRNSLIITYKNKVDQQTNIWEPPNNKNLLAAKIRSQKMIAALKKMQISIKMNPSSIKYYAR